jgi:hypothetical protein
MDSKLRDKITEALAVQGVTDGYICDKTKAIADSILSLLAPILADAKKWDKYKDALIPIEEYNATKEKARKWDRVKEIAKRNELDSYPCEGCSVESMCDSTLSLCGQADTLVEALDALTEKEAT